jgi:hypothetical protein
VMALETSVFSYFNHLTRLVAREDFIIKKSFVVCVMKLLCYFVQLLCLEN